MTDVRVIGAGPAGSAAAIRLARAGMRVRLYEKAVFPRAKLCGGFLSPEALEDLDDLGVLKALRQAGAHAIRRSIVASRGGLMIECPLATETLSVSRSILDDLLVRQAQCEGVEVRMGQDGFVVNEPAAWNVIAAGRKHRVEPFSSPSYVGIQALFANVPSVNDQVEVDLVESGYVGLARQSDGINVCALTTAETVRRWGPDLDRVLIRFAEENPTLRAHLREARRISGWMAVGAVHLGVRQLAQSGTFYVGDAACVSDPFAGEGMAMGLYASTLLTQALKQTQSAPESVYQDLWHQAYDSALRWNALMRLSYRIPFLREPLMHLLKHYPIGMNWLTELTRYRRLDLANESA